MVRKLFEIGKQAGKGVVRQRIGLTRRIGWREVCRLVAELLGTEMMLLLI